MRKGLTLLLCLATMLSCKATEDSTSPPRETELAELLPENKDSIEPMIESGIMSFGEFCDKLDDETLQEFELDGVTYNMKSISIQDLIDQGWCTDCDLSDSVKSKAFVNDAVCCTNKKYPNVAIQLSVVNKSSKTKPIKDCKIGALTIAIHDDGKLLNKRPSCNIPSTGIGLLNSKSEIVKAYGNPSFMYNNDTSFMEYYKTNGNGIKFMLIDNKVAEITIEYYTQAGLQQ